jgi:hypothetical protein
MLNEGNQIHNLISSSRTVINYGSGSSSGSTRQKVMVPTVPVPVPQHCRTQAQFVYRHWWRSVTGTGGAVCIGTGGAVCTGTGGAVCKGAIPSVER